MDLVVQHVRATGEAPPLGVCPKCGGQTFDEACPCTPDEPFDPMLQLAQREERGEEVSFDEYERVALGKRFVSDG